MAGIGGRTRGTRTGNGPGQGPGYGGPARGAGKDIPTIQTRAEFDPGNAVRAKTPWNQRKAELAEKAMGVWERVIDDPEETTPNRIVAAEKIMIRADGLPIQRTQTVPSEFDGMTTDDLERVAAILRGELGGGIGEGGPRDTSAPDGDAVGRVSPVS